MITIEVVADVKYGLIEEAEINAMALLLAEAFSLYEPPAVALGLTAPEIQRLVTAFGPKAVSERLTIVARAAAGDLLGALLVEDFATPPPPDFENIAPRFAPIVALLEGLDSEYRASRSIEPGAYLHLFMVGVAHHASGRGIAHQLITTCLAYGKSRGYSHAVTEATGSASQHIFRKLGFREILTTSYKEFLFEGQHVFSSIVGAEGTILMERQLIGEPIPHEP